MMKKLLALAMAISLIATVTTAGAATDVSKSFTDIGSVEWAKEAISYVANTEIMSGTSKTTFEPNVPVTREQVAKITAVAFSKYNMGALSPFEDVDKDSWAYSYVGSAYESGLITGKSDKVFGFGEQMTREDFCTVLYRAATSTEHEFVEKKSDFTDFDAVSDYAKEAVEFLAGAGVVSGMEDGSFAPKATATRAQAAQMLMKVCELLELEPPVKVGALKEKIELAQKTMESIKEGEAVGEYAAGTKDILKNAIDAANTVVSKADKTQQEVDDAANEITTVTDSIDQYAVVGYTTLNLTKETDIIDSTFIGEIKKEDGLSTIMTGGEGAFFAINEVIPNQNIMTFSTKVDTLEGTWVAYGLRADDPEKKIWAQDCYYFLVKEDIFEIQKKGAIYETAPNNGKFKAGEWNDVEFGALTTAKGVHMFAKVNGEVIFDYLDTNTPNYKAGMFGVHIQNPEGIVEIKENENVSTQVFKRSDKIEELLK